MGDLGHGELASLPTPKLDKEELTRFLTEHQLRDTRDPHPHMPLAERAWRLRQGMLQNPEMFCPLLSLQE